MNAAKRKIAALCLGFCMAGGLGGWYIGKGFTPKQEIQADSIRLEGQDVEWETKTLKPVQSTLKDTKRCWLCGSDNRSLMGYFRQFDDIGIISVNNWYVLDFQIRNHDEEGNLTGAGGGSSSTSVGTGEDGCYFRTDRTPDRGLSQIRAEPGENSVFDAKKVKGHLCQNCLDKLLAVMETYGAVDEPAAPVALCLVDFQTLELYPLQEHNLAYYIRDYYIHIEHDEGETEVMAVYAPILENGEEK